MFIRQNHPGEPKSPTNRFAIDFYDVVDKINPGEPKTMTGRFAFSIEFMKQLNPGEPKSLTDTFGIHSLKIPARELQKHI